MQLLIRGAALITLFGPASFCAIAGELLYTLQSPLVGGNNGALYQVENSRLGMENQKLAKRNAEEQAKRNAEQQAIANSPATRFANALQSQLFMAISQQLSQRIAGLSHGQSGSFTSGDVLVSYVRNASSVTVVINTATGSTTLELPTGS